MTLSNQNFSVRRGEDRTVRFVVEGGAGTISAFWYTSANKASATRDLALASGNGITVADVDLDCHVDVTISKVQSEALPLGWRYHELWGVDGSGQDRHYAEGGMVVEESLRTIPA